MPDLARRRPNAWDVAAYAGVSIATVSRVVNRQRYVRSDTRARVEHAIDVLGYVPNPAARRLAQADQAADAGPIVWIDLSERGTLGVQMLTGALRTAAVAGQSITVVPRAPDQDGATNSDPWSARGEGWFAGYVVVGASGRVSLCFGGRDRCALIADHRAAGRLAGDRLAQGGHTDVLFMTATCADDDVQDARQSGLLSALAAVGGSLELVGVRRDVRDPAPDRVLILQAMQQLNGPTAVVADSVATAVGVYRALRELSLTISEDVSVIAFADEHIETSGHLDPPLTAVDTQYHTVGELAIELLGEMMAGQAADAASVQLVPPRLVEGCSVGMSTNRTSRLALGAVSATRSLGSAPDRSEPMRSRIGPRT